MSARGRTPAARTAPDAGKPPPFAAARRPLTPALPSLSRGDGASAAPRLQRKAVLGAADDAFEREADAVADQVMRHADAAAIRTTAPAVIQRTCAACDDEEKTVRAKRTVHDTASVPDVDRAARYAADGGTPLSPAVRAQFEPRFGHDFSEVRVHADGEAAQAARSVQARAYTVGRHVVFGAGEYAPQRPDGARLLAHELAHVVQQGGGRAPARIQRAVAAEYQVDESFVGKTRPGAAARVNFARNSALIPSSEQAEIDAFKSGADRTVDLDLLGLATEDELAVAPTLPKQRADAVDAELAKPQKGVPPFTMAHVGKRKVTAGTAANTPDSLMLRQDRAVEILRPTDVSLNPSGPIAKAAACTATIETEFQDAKTMAFQWIDDTRVDLQKRPVPAGVAGSLDQFFGAHSDTMAKRVDGNLGRIRDEVKSLAKPANHTCADVKDKNCVGAIAFNNAGRMTICASYSAMTPEDRARNLVHEAGHSTAGLRLTGGRKAPLASDFSYRRERGIELLGKTNPDQALSNSDSYAVFLMTERAPLAITTDMMPIHDALPKGFAKPADADATARAIALAERWARLADQGLTDLHAALRSVGKGKRVPASVGDPMRLDRILAELKRRFPPILSGKDITADDLTMIAGVFDRYQELRRVFAQRIATSPGATTAFTANPPVGLAKTGSLSLTVDSAFLAAKNDRARARILIDEAIELIPTARIATTRRGDYGRFAEFVREMFQ